MNNTCGIFMILLIGCPKYFSYTFFTCQDFKCRNN
uniref:Uncharacterized protein n=1 Tax=Anguilla anguilla TaxID=7936 RepID=A0A0E9WCT2_ANGAN